MKLDPKIIADLSARAKFNQRVLEAAEELIAALQTPPTPEPIIRRRV
jgi:hypothetical protein